MKKNLVIIFFMSLLYTGFAQDTTASADKMVHVDEVLISADKFETPRKNIAQQTQVITAIDMKYLNAQNMGDVLMRSGQVFVQKSQQGGGSPVLRGFEASRVLLVVDGVRMNNILYRAGHLQNIITVDNNTLDRVEVLFGPSSTMYGSDALGGVVHMFTKSPVLSGEKKFYTTGNGLFRYGSVNNELTGHLDFSLAGKKFGSFTAANFSRFGDMRQGEFLTKETAGYWDRNYFAKRVEVNGVFIDSAFDNKAKALQIGSGYTQYDLMQKFLYQQNDNISHTLCVQFSNSSNVPRYDRLAVEVPATKLRDAEWYYGPQRRLLAYYDFKMKNGKALDDVDAGVSYQNIEESRHNRGWGRRFRTSRIEKVDVIGVHADFRKKVKGHLIGFGAEGQFNILKSTAFETDVHVDTTRAASTRYPDGKNTMNYIAVYGTHSWTISPKLIFSQGLRYNFINLHSTFTDQSRDFFPLPFDEISNTYHAVSGNLGLVALPGKGFKIAILGATGFRAPNVDDMAKIFESVPGSVVVPNSKLKPEYSINADLTIEKTFTDKVRWSATGFYTYLFNAITTGVTTFNGADSIDFDGTLSRVTTLQNNNRAFITGVTSAVEADITDWMSAYASFTYTYGRIKTDSTAYPLDHVPPLFGRAGVRMHYKVVRGEFFTVFNAKKKVKDYNMLGEDNFGQGTPPNDLPGWVTFNVRLGFEPVKYFSIDLGCDNIMDLRYRHFASGISAAGRNLFVAVRWRW